MTKLSFIFLLASTAAAIHSGNSWNPLFNIGKVAYKYGWQQAEELQKKGKDPSSPNSWIPETPGTPLVTPGFVGLAPQAVAPQVPVTLPSPEPDYVYDRSVGSTAKD